MTLHTGSVALGNLVQEIANKMKLEGWSEHRFMQTFVPLMTSATSHADFEIFQYRNYSSYYHYEAFDDVIDSTANSWWGYGADLSTGNAYLGLKLKNGAERAIIGYAVTAYCDNNKTDELEIYAPKAWTVQGSNDGTTWTTIHEVTNEVDWYKRERRSYNFTASAVFSQYRIVFTELNTAYSYVRIQRVEFFDANSANNSTFRVMTSTGSSGKDNIVVFLRDPQLTAPRTMGNYFDVGFAENFNTVNEALKNEYMRSYYLTSTSSQSSTYWLYLDTVIKYDIKVTRDSLFVATYTDPAANYPANNCFYVGLMKRHSQEDNSWAQVLLVGTYGPSTYPRVLKTRQGVVDQYIYNRWVSHSWAPSVWGNNIFISPIFLEGIYEGIRGELEGIYCARVENMMNGDEVVVDGVTYRAVVTNAIGNTQFPTTCVLFKVE